jgi:hypothetical protein
MYIHCNTKSGDNITIIKQTLENAREDMIAWATPVFEKLETTINSDIQEIIEYAKSQGNIVDEDDLTHYFEANDVNKDSIIDGFEYYTESDFNNGYGYCWFWANPKTTIDTDDYNDYCNYMKEFCDHLVDYGDLDLNCSNSMFYEEDKPFISYYGPEVDCLVTSIIYYLSLYRFAIQLTQENAVSICKRIIYQFAQFISETCVNMVSDAIERNSMNMSDNTEYGEDDEDLF